MYVAIQQIKGKQPTSFMKLATPLSEIEVEECRGKRLSLDQKWMEANGYTATADHWSTSPIVDLIPGEDPNVLLLITEHSVYQLIPDFST